VQLRQDNLAGTLYNLVGFQTNLKWGDQQRVFSMIPGLERAEFVRFGQMHRNTFVNSPGLLDATLECRDRPGLFFAGQMTGTEGYIASTGSGLVAGVNCARTVMGRSLLAYPRTTMLGALCDYVSSAEAEHFQPMKPNFGLLPALEGRRMRKRQRHGAYAKRGIDDLRAFVSQTGIPAG
jgi:methylenetetrahydrofolate--tRNA-(uracil-5-)-methyltransferase